MKRFYELASRLSAQAAVAVMLLGLMLAGSSSRVLADGPLAVISCVSNCNSGAPNDDPPCSTKGGTCVRAAGAPANSVCSCTFMTHFNDATGVANACSAICG